MQAAFNIGTIVRWLDLTTPGSPPSGAILRQPRRHPASPTGSAAARPPAPGSLRSARNFLSAQLPTRPDHARRPCRHDQGPRNPRRVCVRIRLTAWVSTTCYWCALPPLPSQPLSSAARASKSSTRFSHAWVDGSCAAHVSPRPQHRLPQSWAAGDANEPGGPPRAHRVDRRDGCPSALTAGRPGAFGTCHSAASP